MVCEPEMPQEYARPIFVVEGDVFKTRSQITPQSLQVGPDTAQFLLEGLPGCGPKTAKPLVSTFGSALAAFNASVDELCKVPGVGKKTAERIRDALTWQAPTGTWKLSLAADAASTRRSSGRKSEDCR
ncbi:helix-hairpin-helix domain-containing protein [Paraburkholderia sp. EG287A]|uniref:helix-hairpin-helix domain-containing protein n=1 Tax=Paraburkholderia sp. EG287A TaxID=3237012 RepID=UPI0034D21CB3